MLSELFSKNFLKSFNYGSFKKSNNLLSKLLKLFIFYFYFFLILVFFFRNIKILSSTKIKNLAFKLSK